MNAARLSPFDVVGLTLGFAFLYLPILIVIAFSFNDGRLVTVWSGFSTRWYAALLQNEALLAAARVSLLVACVSATGATLIGLLAALALTRFRRFRGRALFSTLAHAPLVMPEVMLGLSLLLFFVALGVDRGFWTVIIAHVTFTCAFALVVIHARLATVDASVEEAAIDLGAPPAQAFLMVTLPAIAPAVAAAWMLAFALSLDDLVIASFTSGPAATTLPMRVYSQVRLGVTPEINAISTILIGVVAIAVIAASLLTRRRDA